MLVHAFARFVTEGAGTPAPVAPTERLVIGGLYRYVRNPMYLAVIATITGQAVVLGSPELFGYDAAVAVAVASFVWFYEEPALARQFGTAYDAYRHAVPGWRPRLRAWTGGAARPGSSTRSRGSPTPGPVPPSWPSVSSLTTGRARLVPARLVTWSHVAPPPGRSSPNRGRGR